LAIEALMRDLTTELLSVPLCESYANNQDLKSYGIGGWEIWGWEGVTMDGKLVTGPGFLATNAPIQQQTELN